MNFATKRGASGAIFFDKDGKILFLETTYKENWEIPGGIIEEQESPIQACRREIQEEIGLSINIKKLLCLEYQKEIDDSYMFVFLGGVLEKTDIHSIVIQESEIKSIHFLFLEDAKDKVLPKLYTRIHHALKALKKGDTEYYETIHNNKEDEKKLVRG